jgi:hypothetical protein
MCRGNAGFAFGCFWSCAAPAVVLALLGFAKLEHRSAALYTRATAFGCAAQALDFPTRCQKLTFCVHRNHWYIPASQIDDQDRAKFPIA